MGANCFGIIPQTSAPYLGVALPAAALSAMTDSCHLAVLGHIQLRLPLVNSTSAAYSKYLSTVYRLGNEDSKLTVDWMDLCLDEVPLTAAS